MGEAEASASWGRRRSNLVIVSAILVVLVLLAAAWWFYSRPSPAHSIALLSSAIRGGDRVTAMRYIDVDEILRRRVTAAAATGATGTPTLDHTYVDMLVAANAGMFRSQLAEAFDPRARAKIASPSILDTAVRATDVRRVVYAGDEASVTVTLPSSQGPFDVELRMRKVGSEWHVVGFAGDLKRMLNH